MKVAIGSDHAGFPLKQAVIEAVIASGNEPVDFGVYNGERSDYPDYSEKVGRAIQSQEAERGILLCGSGIGACIAANKLKGIYAAVCHDTYSAHQGVEHDQMNVLCLGGRIIGVDLAKEIVTDFLGAVFSGKPDHQRRVDKIKKLENE